MSNIDKRELREAAEKSSADNRTHDEWFHYLHCSRPAVVLTLLDELEAAEKRIAELEAREVKLPKPISVLHRRDFTDAHRSIYAYPEAEVNAALVDAGIRIHGED